MWPLVLFKGISKHENLFDRPTARSTKTHNHKINTGQKRNNQDVLHQLGQFGLRTKVYAVVVGELPAGGSPQGTPYFAHWKHSQPSMKGCCMPTLAPYSSLSHDLSPLHATMYNANSVPTSHVDSITCCLQSGGRWPMYFLVEGLVALASEPSCYLQHE